MKNLRKYHATGKVSYRKGVLYEIDRVPKDDSVIGEKKNSAKGFFRRTIESVSGFFAKINFFKGNNRPKRSIFIRKKFGKTPSRPTNADKKFYIMSGSIAAGVVLVTALVTTVALARDTVTINDEGRISYATIQDGQTVNELLAANDISISEGDAVEVSDDQTLTDGMQIVIHRAMPVTVYADGETQKVNMLAGTVGDVLSEAGITLGEEDEVYPSEKTYITSGMSINVIRVEVKYVSEKSTIEYKEITKQSDKYLKGQRYLSQAGQNGTLETKYKVIYKNGEEFSKEKVEEKVLKEAQDQIVLVGTYVAPQATQKPSTGGSSSNSGGSSSGGSSQGSDYGQGLPTDSGLLTKLPSISQIHSGTLSQHKSVPAPSPELISKVVSAETTAYYLPGNKTSTGTYARIGTIAANPKKIPYGTLIYVPGYGYGRVEDTGPNHNPNYWLDLHMNSYNECINWGRRTVKIYILKG